MANNLSTTSRRDALRALNTSRRALIGVLAGAPVIAAVATAGTSAAPISHNDRAIFAAWQRYGELREQINAIPDDNDWERTPLWSKADAEEMIIKSTSAHSPKAAAVVLWLALDHSDDAALAGMTWTGELRNRDVRALRAVESDLDWGTKLIVRGLLSLEEMRA